MRTRHPHVIKRYFSNSSSSRINLIQIQNGTFYREYPSSLSGPQAANPPLFPNLTFELSTTLDSDVSTHSRKNGHWAVVGAQGVSVFLDVLRGNLLCIPPNARTFPYLASDKIAAKDLRMRIPSNAIRYVGFNTGNKSGLGGVGGTQGAYLSARYESRREETDWSVLQYLRGETDLNPSEQLSHRVTDQALLDRVIADLRLERLLDMPVSNLSNGQSRRCRIAKALLDRPECLLLDEPFMGLDPPTLAGLSPMLRSLAYKSDPLLVLGLRPQDPVPDWITDLVVLGKDHNVALTGKKEDVLNALVEFGARWQKDESQNVSSEISGGGVAQLQRWLEKPFKGVGDILTDRGIVSFTSISHGEKDSRDIKASRSQTAPDSEKISSTSRVLGDPLIELQDITLSYGTKTILGHKTHSNPEGGLRLTIRQGTRLALLGPNGSGKTTLLSLLTSDHPQSYSLPIKFFGRTRLPERGKPGLSLWEIQSRIGHSSPEVHAFYPKTHSVRRVLESAWAETYSSKPRLDQHANDLIDHVLTHWTPELRQDQHNHHDRSDNHNHKHNNNNLTWSTDQETHRFNILPFSTQRLLLFLRAIIKSPPIVILDEAFSGLDSTTREKAMTFLEHGTTSNSNEIFFPGLTDRQALVVVSHVREEVPGCVDEWIRLPSEEEAMELGKGVLGGRADELADGKGLRSKEGWGLVWGL